MSDRLNVLKEVLQINEIAPHLHGINHLILIPHRDLHRFPLHALFDFPDCTITYLPSAQLGLNLQGRLSNPVQSLLNVENPASNRVSSMSFARVEAQGICQEFDQVYSLREQDAAQTQVLLALQAKQHSVFHFAGHAAHNPAHPNRSELILAGDAGLTLEEIGHLDLSHLDLVSLSACETAMTGNQTITAEYVGLVSGFLRQGVAQVISTLWVVESVASALVMIEFYRRRADRPDAIALQQALTWLRQLTRTQYQQWQAELLESLFPYLSDEQRKKIKRSLEHQLIRWDMMEPDQLLFNHPYYWAAFILSGKAN